MNQIAAMLLRRSLLLTTAMALSACSLLSKPPAKQLFAINVGRPQPANISSPGSTLRVLPVSVADPFSKLAFQYLIAPNQFQQDYYANFVADPGRLLTVQLIEWMTATRLHGVVVDSSSPVRADRALQCLVQQLYGDMSDPASPRAVIAARFFLLDETSVEAKVLFSREYRQVEPVTGTGADELVQAWNRAMRRIFQRLTANLRSVP